MKQIARLLAATLCLTILVGCADPGSAPEAVTDTAIESRTDAELRAHYDALLTTLREELANIREDAYITHETLLARIEALEAALESLGVTLPDTPPAPVETGKQPIESTGTEAPSDELRPTDTTASTAGPTLTDPDARFAYTVENGRATVTAYRPDGKSDDISVPATLGGYPVTAIGDNAFANTTLRRVTLSPGVTDIGWFAFSGCMALEAVTLPATVARIDYGAFDGCPALTLYCPTDSYAARYADSFGIPRAEP